MFAKLFILYGFVAVSLTLPVLPFSEPVPILQQNQEINPDGSFKWNYQSEDGSSQNQQGQLKQVGTEEAGEVVQGSASWIDPEGGAHQISYVADENGYKPSSADLPVAPEIPQAIVRALEWIADHPALEEQTK
ncbi:endocuticle structural glycoprotein ABD-4-like [Euwallacea fornicatus]|uniref:endocuticle structural glycoprotein ABD-4-like n=1 Tax=Euwallacea fornicatus TaxID=995702 RepID=UPI00338EB292